MHTNLLNLSLPTPGLSFLGSPAANILSYIRLNRWEMVIPMDTFYPNGYQVLYTKYPLFAILFQQNRYQGCGRIKINA